MLTIFNSKLNNSNSNKKYFKLEYYNEQKKFLPSNKEWYNSIYVFNKNSLNLLPIADKIVTKLIRSYFNLFNRILNIKIRYRKLRIRMRRISSHRIYISKPEFKHIYKKVLISLYIYNRQKYNFLNKIKRKVFDVNNNKLYKISLIRKKGLVVLKKIINDKKAILNSLKWKENFRNYDILYYKHFIQKSLRREMLQIYYKQILLFNKSKFENTFLYTLISLIKKIYNKNVEFNIVSLKYFYFNSEIFTESLSLKLRKRKNRLLKVLKKSLSKVRIADLNKYEYINTKSHNLPNTNINVNLLDTSFNKDPLNRLLFKSFYNKIFSNNKTISLQKLVLNSLNNKVITGIRIEAAGRLSRRITASRSVFKIMYKGSLKNIDSSYKGLSSGIIRGHVRPNIQYSFNNYKTRIGSYGIKGWVSSNHFSTKPYFE